MLINFNTCHKFKKISYGKQKKKTVRYLAPFQTTQTYPAFKQKSFSRVQKKNNSKRLLNFKKKPRSSKLK